MPFNILITFVIGSALGWLLVKLTRAPQHLRGLVLGCCAAGTCLCVISFDFDIDENGELRMFLGQFEQETWATCL